MIGLCRYAVWEVEEHDEARRFRSRGTEGAAIADLMRDLRLMHGGFTTRYVFPSAK
jgi:hypothetical protein